MDMQLKKGVLDVIVPAILMRGDSYGYSIIQSMLPIVQVSESTLYPILRRLEASGRLVSYNAMHGGRMRKYYNCTPLGRQRVKDFLVEWSDFDRILAFIKGTVNGGYYE